jgi:outer membrane protein
MPEAQAPIPVDVEAEQRGLPRRDLTLGDALRLGRANNVELHAAELLPQQARQDLIGAEAVFAPEFYGSVGYSDSQQPARNAFQPSVETKAADATIGWRQRVVTGGLFDLAYQPAKFTITSASGAFPEKQYVSQWSMSYTQPLLRAAWTDFNLAPIDAARHSVTRADQDFEQSVQDTLLKIVIAYWELAFARENYRVVVAALDVAKEQLRITDERIRVRELAPRDRVADEAEIAQRNEELIVAEHLIRSREDDLRRLLFDDQHGELWRWNLHPIDEIAITPGTDEIPIEPLVDAALENRPDIKSLRSSVAEAELQKLQADRDTLPQLDLVSTYSSDGVRDQFSDAFRDSGDQQYPDWALRLQFSMPVGNQAARSRQRRAQLELEHRQRVLYSAMMDVGKEVREVTRLKQSFAESIHASGVSVRLSETNLETEQVKLRVGASTAFEVQRRNQDLRTARSRYLRNQIDYRIADSRLLHAQGILHAPRD